MLVQVSLLSKALGAPSLIALERPFSSMHSQVVEEVVPFPEEHSAIFMVTFQDFDISLSPRVLILKHPEHSSLWNVLINLDRAEIEFISVLYMNFSAFWYFLSYFIISDILLADLLSVIMAELLLVHKAKLAVSPYITILKLIQVLVSGPNLFLNEVVYLLSFACLGLLIQR